MSLQEQSDVSVAGVDADRLGRPVATGEVTPTGSATSTGSAASRIRQASDDAPSASSTTISTANQSYMDATLPWDKFSNWVHCICVVTFDLELGQALEVVYPGYCNLTATEKMNICYLAFPDSNSGCTGDTRFHFRMRRFSGKSLNTAQEAYDQRAPVYLQTDPVHYFGFVHFRQTKDKTIPRGYLQKSVVLVTLLPLVNLFTHVVETIAPRFFESGEPAIEAACHDIDQWPAPQPGVTFNLPLMGSIVQCRIPSHYDMPNYQKPLVVTAQESTHLAPTLLPTVHEPQLFENLAPIVPHLQLLWELVLIGEPLVAMSPSPTHCSGVVQSLVSLIWPLRYCYDYRPFFTIHDSEFKEYTSKTQAPPKLVLGVTNPFFTKTLQHWPHIVRIGDANSGQATTAAAAKVFKKSTDGRTLDTKPGLYSQYKPFLAKDKALLKRILKGAESQRPVEVQSMILRRHFLEVTQSFMIPLERYLASLMPLQKQISPFKAAPQARRFDLEEFLATVADSGPGLTSGLKGNWTGLYRRFVESANFDGWLRQRRKEVDHKLQLLHLEVLCATDFSECDLPARHEVELVDLVLKLLDKIEFAESNPDSVSSAQRTKLQAQMRTILATVDEDLKSVLMSNMTLKQTVVAVQ
uniref:UDENN domain-containing protein n=1 Tax=Plectus sambesii TaxID=2011161 RepID=A0A914WA65_9BILA